MTSPVTHLLQLVTDRLRLRSIEDRDLAPFIAMNLDPEVMYFFPSTFSLQQSEEHAARYRMQLARDGFSFLTVEDRETGQYLGIVGMQIMRTVVPNLPQPAVEIGWRLVRAAHGMGYATEAARAIVDYAFNTLHLPEVVAVVAAGNVASQRVVQKLGMTHRPDLTFDYPEYPPGHPHASHFLYSLANPNPKQVQCSTPS